MNDPQQGVIQRVPVVPSPIAGTFTFPANKAAPTVPIPVMVQRPHTTPARVEVVVGVSRTFRGTGGTLEEKGHTVSFRWFDKAKGGTLITIPATWSPSPFATRDSEIGFQDIDAEQGCLRITRRQP